MPMEQFLIFLLLLVLGLLELLKRAVRNRRAPEAHTEGERGAGQESPWISTLEPRAPVPPQAPTPGLYAPLPAPSPTPEPAPARFPTRAPLRREQKIVASREGSLQLRLVLHDRAALR